MDRPHEAPASPAPPADNPSHGATEALHTDLNSSAQQMASTYKVCKDGTVVFPPAKCPEEEKGHIPHLELNHS